LASRNPRNSRSSGVLSGKVADSEIVSSRINSSFGIVVNSLKKTENTCPTGKVPRPGDWPVGHDG
ncbi:hypothetical protein, partial [Xenorhabdus sp. IM139775]|uniref:hypothetical protein n=1 Tax=Xenorhabdus sp. IM139775 TaxID=3025876 RepID=UPI0023584218